MAHAKKMGVFICGKNYWKSFDRWIRCGNTCGDTTNGNRSMGECSWNRSQEMGSKRMKSVR